MKNTTLFFLCFIFLAGISSCKKDEPTPDSQPPVFYFRGTVGSAQVDLEAGVNNYYMYSSFNQDQNNVYGFSGNLGVYNCASCGNSLQVKINDFQVSPLNGNAAIQNSITPGYYPYYITGGKPTEYNLSFNSYGMNGNPVSYSWDFGDGMTESSANYGCYHTFARPGTYHLKNKVTFSSGASDSTDYNIRFGIPEAEMQGGFATSAAGNDVTFNGSFSGVQPFTYFWDFGDGNTSTQTLPFHHVYMNPGIYKVYVHITDANGGVFEMERNSVTQNYSGVYSTFYTGTASTNPNPFGFSNITVEWKNSSGVTYTSNNATQPASSYFKIISVEDYENNSSGQRTKKIHLNFKCKVYTATDSLQIDNGDAIIAVAYQ